MCRHIFFFSWRFISRSPSIWIWLVSHRKKKWRYHARKRKSGVWQKTVQRRLEISAVKRLVRVSLLTWGMSTGVFFERVVEELLLLLLRISVSVCGWTCVCWAASVTSWLHSWILPQLRDREPGRRRSWQQHTLLRSTQWATFGNAKGHLLCYSSSMLMWRHFWTRSLP